MIRFDALTLARGSKPLLLDASAVIHAGETVGLIGTNGSGKSTLFALLRGEVVPDAGDVDVPAAWRIAHVAQDTVASERAALDFVVDGDRALRDVEAAIRTAELAEGGRLGGVVDGSRLAELHAAFGDVGGYTAEARAGALLLGLGFANDALRRPVATFSGGWRMRLALAQALMAPSDLLLLDEPTNHLDVDAIVWLEQWLRRYDGTAIVVSHDREFLDAVSTTTLAIEQRRLVRSSGGYSDWERERAERMRQAQGAYERQQRDIAHLQGFVDRFRAKATKARQAQSRIKALERMTRLAPARFDSPFTFRFRAPAASPDPVMIAEGLDCGYRSEDGSRTILRGVDLRLAPGDRVALLGANGQGKSTLVKTIAGTLAPLAGTIVPGRGLVVGYFAQHQVDMLDLDASPLVQLARIAAASGPAPREQDLRDWLGTFGFGGDAATAPVAPLSGGEKARLALALIIWTRPNLLVLDEPTNHLDLDTREALTLALAQFDGTLVLVSHDRALLRATADRFVVVQSGRVTAFDGDLDDYLDDCRDSSLARTKPVGTEIAPAPQEAQRAREQRRAEAETRNARARERKPIEDRIRRIERKLAEAGAAKAAVEASLAAPDLYRDASKDALKQALLEQAFLARDIETLETQWLEQQTLLEGAA